MAAKTTKNRSKLSFRAFRFPHRFLYRFLIDFCFQLRPNGSPRTLFFHWKTWDFQKNAFRREYRFRLRFWCQLACMLASKIEDFSKWWPSKKPSKFHRFLHRFFIDLGSVLASNMGPSWGPRWIKIRNFGLKNVFKSFFTRMMETTNKNV